jgi:hypothetical protein
LGLRRPKKLKAESSRLKESATDVAKVGGRGKMGRLKDRRWEVKKVRRWEIASL